jgi:hypothetical protein
MIRDIEQNTFYGVFYSYCIYESAESLVSLHRSKKTALAAKHMLQYEICVEERNKALKYGKRYYENKWYNGVSFSILEIKLLP